MQGFMTKVLVGEMDEQLWADVKVASFRNQEKMSDFVQRALRRELTIGSKPERTKKIRPAK
jgi:hypothetical protein